MSLHDEALLLCSERPCTVLKLDSFGVVFSLLGFAWPYLILLALAWLRFAPLCFRFRFRFVSLSLCFGFAWLCFDLSAVSRSASLCLAVPRFASLCLAVPHSSLLFLALPRPALPRLTSRRLALPRLVSPCVALLGFPWPRFALVLVLCSAFVPSRSPCQVLRRLHFS